MKSGVENMLDVLIKDKKRTKELESQLETYNTSIDNTTKRIEHIRTNAGSNIIEIAKLLKKYKYIGTSFSDAITPSTLAQSRSKLRPFNGQPTNSKGKQKASLENVSYPDDGKHFCVCSRACFIYN
jgi:rapamycin-insensitive companion of mTOR